MAIRLGVLDTKLRFESMPYSSNLNPESNQAVLFKNNALCVYTKNIAGYLNKPRSQGNIHLCDASAQKTARHTPKSQQAVNNDV